jgi:hypothetical protein
MPSPTLSAVAGRTDGRDRFRDTVATLPPGPLRDVLTAVSYARDAAARTGAAAAPDDRWRALVAAAERALLESAGTETLPRLVAA